MEQQAALQDLVAEWRSDDLVMVFDKPLPFLEGRKPRPATQPSYPVPLVEGGYGEHLKVSEMPPGEGGRDEHLAGMSGVWVTAKPDGENIYRLENNFSRFSVDRIEWINLAPSPRLGFVVLTDAEAVA